MEACHWSEVLFFLWGIALDILCFAYDNEEASVLLGINDWLVINGDKKEHLFIASQPKGRRPCIDNIYIYNECEEVGYLEYKFGNDLHHNVKCEVAMAKEHVVMAKDHVNNAKYYVPKAKYHIAKAKDQVVKIKNHVTKAKNQNAWYTLPTWPTLKY